jgi:hypothetical protein
MPFIKKNHCFCLKLIFFLLFYQLFINQLGYDSAELVQKLKVEIAEGKTTSGLNMFSGKVDCMQTLGITVKDNL